MNKAKDQSIRMTPLEPVIESTNEAMSYYMVRACLEADTAWANAPRKCYAALVAGYLTAAATIHAGHKQAQTIEDGLKELNTTIDRAISHFSYCEASVDKFQDSLVKISKAADAEKAYLMYRIQVVEAVLEKNGYPAFDNCKAADL